MTVEYTGGVTGLPGVQEAMVSVETEVTVETPPLFVIVDAGSVTVEAEPEMVTVEADWYFVRVEPGSVTVLADPEMVTVEAGPLFVTVETAVCVTVDAEHVDDEP